MGFVTVTGECVSCGRPFSFNPHKVPSITVRGQREPICRACIDYINPTRVKNGLAPIVPLPGAYDAMDEAGL